MTNFDDLIDDPNNGPITSTHTVCVSQKLHEEHSRLLGELAALQELQTGYEDELQRLKRGGPGTQQQGTRRMVGGTTAQQVGKSLTETKKKIDATNDALDRLRADNPKAFYDIVVQALPEDQWLALRAQHPVTDKTTRVIDAHDIDGRTGGIDLDTFAKPAAIRCMVDPEPTEKRVEFLTRVLSTGEWRRLGITTFNVNEGEREIPKSLQLTSTTTSNERD